MYSKNIGSWKFGVRKKCTAYLKKQLNHKYTSLQFKNSFNVNKRLSSGRVTVLSEERKRLECTKRNKVGYVAAGPCTSNGILFV